MKLFRLFLLACGVVVHARASLVNITATAGTCNNGLPAGTHTVQLSSGGKSRSFDIFVPEGLVEDTVNPAVFMWHGFGGSPTQVADFTHASTAAAKKRYFVIYPKGSGLLPGFNGAGCCPGVFNDDVTFFRNMVTWLESNMCVDSNNIFSAGFSNGGFMSNRLACEASDLVKAIAVHSGSIGLNFECKPSKGMPVLMIHGTADATVPYFGNGQWNAFSQLANIWAGLNQCGDETNAHVGYRSEKTECTVFDACARDSVPMQICTVEDMGHKWAGDGDFEIDATMAIFEFFEAQAEPSNLKRFFH
jgi:polyhydroxybutyrate depolymerase|mmetsp:Transcript_2312/g.3133  ORF Transcript_2312/g.3133 Transcript_2312/m.3133 type:complete len:304 (-) Transcript_2312:347-1258(-)